MIFFDTLEKKMNERVWWSKVGSIGGCSAALVDDGGPGEAFLKDMERVNAIFVRLLLLFFFLFWFIIFIFEIVLWHNVEMKDNICLKLSATE